MVMPVGALTDQRRAVLNAISTRGPPAHRHNDASRRNRVRRIVEASEGKCAIRRGSSGTMLVPITAQRPTFECFQ